MSLNFQFLFLVFQPAANDVTAFELVISQFEVNSSGSACVKSESLKINSGIRNQQV